MAISVRKAESVPVWAEVDEGRIRANVARIKELLRPGTKLLAVVKANGYGHGDARAAAAAVAGGADWLGVARTSEGESLRAHGISQPILLLAEAPSGAVPKIFELDLTPTVYTSDFAQDLESASEAFGKPIQVHLKVDTGMHRYGVAPADFSEFFERVMGIKGLDVTGVWSHFAVAEDVLSPYTQRQFETFTDVLSSLGPRVNGLIKHMANSAGILTLPESHMDMVRAGILVYGIAPSSELSRNVKLEPAMAFKSRVGQVKRLPASSTISYGQKYTLSRESTVATIPCGYADGLTRALTNRGEVLIRGKRYRISGTITMDHFLVDVGDDVVEVGDEAVMIGKQGSEEITASEVAKLLGTIPYEVVCGISSRVPRFYVDG